MTPEKQRTVDVCCRAWICICLIPCLIAALALVPILMTYQLAVGIIQRGEEA
jgi:hypothetical protein